jgi:hypothetical protein
MERNENVYAHSIHNPDGVRFVGPLAPLAAELKGEFARLGYAMSSATAQLQLAAHLSRWLQAEGLGTQDLTGAVIEGFLAARRRGYSGHYSAQALAPLLDFLRRAGYAPPEPVASEPCSGTERLLARFGDYLRVERGLTARWSRRTRIGSARSSRRSSGPGRSVGGLLGSDGQSVALEAQG